MSVAWKFHAHRRALLVVLAVLLWSFLADAQSDPLHIWAGNLNHDTAQKWVSAHLDQEQKDIDRLLAAKGPHTIANTLQPYDDAQNELAVAGQEAYLMYAVAPAKDVRDAGQALAEKVNQVATALTLNQDVYHALAAVDLSAADATTKHYMERTLLEYRLAGVDRDAATRAEIKKKFDLTTELGLKFGRNVQENVNHVVVKDKSELAGLPADFISAHRADK